MSRTLFISDLHFSHANIIRYDERPFGSADEMDDAMVALWNETVNDADLVYVLGDISWARPDKTARIFGSLKGRKFLVRGNHDTDKLLTPEVRECFIGIERYVDTMVGNRRVVLSHFPIMFFDRCLHGVVHLYGHVHNSCQWELTERFKRVSESFYGREFQMYNVGCMMPYVDYIPRTLDEIETGYRQLVAKLHGLDDNWYIQKES